MPMQSINQKPVKLTRTSEIKQRRQFQMEIYVQGNKKIRRKKRKKGIKESVSQDVEKKIRHQQDSNLRSQREIDF